MPRIDYCLQRWFSLLGIILIPLTALGGMWVHHIKRKQIPLGSQWSMVAMGAGMQTVRACLSPWTRWSGEVYKIIMHLDWWCLLPRKGVEKQQGIHTNSHLALVAAYVKLQGPNPLNRPELLPLISGSLVSSTEKGCARSHR